MLLVFLLLWVSPTFAATHADMAITVYDADNHPVPDVLIVAVYQTNGTKPALDGLASGLTNTRGQWRTSLIFGDNITPAQYVQLMAYAPSWSSERVQARISTSAGQELNANFTIPALFDTYRVQLSGPGGAIPGAELQLVEPSFVLRRTDSNGLAQMRFPRGSTVRGTLSYAGESIPLDFTSQADAPEGTPRQSLISYPFENAAVTNGVGPYNLTARVLDPAGRLVVRAPITIQIPNAQVVYRTDGQGILRLVAVPYSPINLTWALHNATYNLTLDLTNAPDEIHTPVLLTLQTPQVMPLGESCYRVLVNATDPRVDAIIQVRAVPEKASDVLPFTLDSHLTIDERVVHFNRVLCVMGDTGFDIVALNQYENTSLRIQLRQNDAVASPISPGGVAVIGVVVPKVDTSKTDDAHRIELVVILVELLVFLAIVYALVRFKDLVLFYGQSMLRTMHAFYRGLRISSARKKIKNEPPPPTAS